MMDSELVKVTVSQFGVNARNSERFEYLIYNVYNGIGEEHRKWHYHLFKEQLSETLLAIAPRWDEEFLRISVTWEKKDEPLFIQELKGDYYSAIELFNQLGLHYPEKRDQH